MTRKYLTTIPIVVKGTKLLVRKPTMRVKELLKSIYEAHLETKTELLEERQERIVELKKQVAELKAELASLKKV